MGVALAGEGQLESFSAVSLYRGVTGRMNVPVLQLPPGSRVPSALQAGAGARATW